MVAIKYTPIVATAFLSLYTGVSASVLSKRQVAVPSLHAPIPPTSSSSAYGGRAYSHRAAADPSSAAPANTFGLGGTVPGDLVASQGGHTVAIIPIADLGVVPTSIDVSALGDLNSNLTALLNTLAGLAGQLPGAAPVPAPVPLPVPGVPSTDPISALLNQTLGAIQGLLLPLGQLPPNGTVPPNASDTLTALLASLTTVTSASPSLLGLLGGGIPSTSGSLNTLGDLIALTLALVPVLTSLISILQLGGQ